MVIGVSRRLRESNNWRIEKEDIDNRHENPIQQ
jgi:hypothetical protein